MKKQIAMTVALVLATIVGTVAASYAAPQDSGAYHRLGQSRDQSVNGG